MPLDQSFAGRSWPPTAPYLVGREKIRSSPRRSAPTSREYHDPEAPAPLGYADVVAPPDVPDRDHDGRQPADHRRPELGMDYSRVLHGDQRFAYAAARWSPATRWSA
jgi:hypothetical protein